MLKFAFLSKIIRVLLDINTKALYICIIRKQQNNQTMKKWNYQIVSIQRWNNDNEVVLSYHKTLQAAEREKRANERKNKSYLKRYPNEKGNDYRIEEI